MIELKNINYQISNFVIVKNISLFANKGEIISIIGPNGCGKTSLFNIINGFLMPTSGDIFFNSKNITRLNVFKKVNLGIGRLWQDTRLFHKMTVLENLITAVREHPGESIIRNIIRTKAFKSKTIEIRDLALSYIELVGLKEMVNVETENLSYGQQKLVALCRLFMNNSKLVLLDEPFAGVNYVYIEKIQELIIKLKELNNSVIIIEHNIAMAKNLSQRMYAMSEGEIISEGNPDDVVNSDKLKEAYAGI